jgi:short-subunit dehydrogenase
MKTPGIVVITGASAGVGRATARAFARRGAKVALLARGEDGLQDTRREIQGDGGVALAITVDVAVSEAVMDAAARVERELGPIEVWVNNAMVSVFSPFEQMTPDEFRRVTEVTYLGQVHGTMAALRYMVPRDRGVIVQVGSALAYRSIPLQSAYCGAKAAMRGFTDSVRSELRHDNRHVHITMVQMPALSTPQLGWTRGTMLRKTQPVPPALQPEVAARAIVWASQHRRRELHVAWPTINAIALAKLAPSMGDWVLARSGYDSLETPEPRDLEGPESILATVDQDRGARRSFDGRARSRSPLPWAATYRRVLRVAIALAAATHGSWRALFDVATRRHGSVART